MAFEREKLKALVLHVCSECDLSRLGAVKLHKVLYFVDMLRYADAGQSVTGSTYRKRHLGPTCDQLPSVLGELESSGALEIKTVDYFGYMKKEYIAKVGPDTNRLSAEEVELADEVVDFVCNANSARTISEFSHNKAWEIADFGAVMPYFSVFNIFPVEVSKEAVDWASNEVAGIEAAGPQPNAVDSTPYSVFRKRILQEMRGH